MANGLLWGGLALIVLGTAGCIIGLGGGFGAALEGDAATAEFGGSMAAFSAVGFLLGLLLVGVGAILKMFGKR
ncbi:MAG: hypothetical protein OXL97_01295 [Chloroflexota bacterium]|nr:hypothetical protein [Chloroflexota bacterium]MDE2884367.1 hypothetical protein [Chloroflexota bacterium]